MRLDLDCHLEKVRRDLQFFLDGLWIGVNINYDGTVVPCCFDTHEKFIFGNAVTTENFETDIWNSRKFQAFRKNVWEDKGSVEMCKNCPTNTESQDYARVKFSNVAVEETQEIEAVAH